VALLGILVERLGAAGKEGDVNEGGLFLFLPLLIPPDAIDGHSSKEKLEKFRAGILNQSDLIGEEGRNRAETLIERGEEIAARTMNRLAMEKKYGIEIDPREYLMLTPNEQPPQQTNEPDA